MFLKKKHSCQERACQGRIVVQVIFLIVQYLSIFLAHKELEEREQVHKDYERKRPGILKDSSYDNSPIYKSTQGLSSHPLKKTLDPKMTIGPQSTKNQRNLRSEPSIVHLYSPNGLLTNQLDHYNPHKASEYIFLSFQCLISLGFQTLKLSIQNHII